MALKGVLASICITQLVDFSCWVGQSLLLLLFPLSWQVA